MSKVLNNPHLIGKIHSSQDVRGAIFVILQTEKVPWLNKWDTLFVSDSPASQNFTSYKIVKKAAHSKQGKKGYIVELEEVKDRDLAEAMAHKAVWIPEDYLVSQKGETIYLREILGFEVVDDQRGPVGPVVAFSSNGPQDLLVLQYKGAEFEVPFVKAFLKNIDFPQKKIFMDIPLGLLEDGE
jgi:16S rRNA processing protein RimM